jgi:ERCC4-related helicase
MLTLEQARYIAYQLTKRTTSESPEKFSATLYDAQVDLNPHQVEAALFAFRNPLSKGAILADEVGLGKTIEAGILLSQFWAQQKRNLLIICPSSLRKQWQQELADKFFLDSFILETKEFNKRIDAGKRNPFDDSRIVICSYHFAKNKEDYLRLRSWNLVVIDEAHRLRNVYKKSNKIGTSIKDSLAEIPKILLTATPLQNSLMELFGLVSLIDEQVFGDKKSFRKQFSRLSEESDDFDDLKNRIKPICKRNLRRQVQEYISYTKRIPITVKFEPTDEEQALYEMVTEYLQRELLYALPSSQRHLMTLIMRKLLASSTYAISGTLRGLVKKLQKSVDEKRIINLEEKDVEGFETLDEYQEEWPEEVKIQQEFVLTEEERDEIRDEIRELQSFYELAEGIENNAKGEKLIQALGEAFSKMSELNAPEKAIIFTESTRTQNYLFHLLEKSAYSGKVVLFNGSNNGDKAKQIYNHWKDVHKGTTRVSGNKSVDIRSALTDYFKEEATIMIATEAAAEGINLQFCSTVVNYDLPWNPQRIEQRIGRCHRYGQKYDVVVVNFVNVNNAADRRVFDLLDQKFQLFNGVFGASDDVLGAVESGVDFERRIGEIYQTCRTEKEIQKSFDELQTELDEQIQSKLQTTRQKLLENFDIEVIEKLKITQEQSIVYLNRYQKWLWKLMKFSLQNIATFNDEHASFYLPKSKYTGNDVPIGHYKIANKVEDSFKLRIGHPLTENIIRGLKNSDCRTRHLLFDLSNYEAKVAALDPYIGTSGWLQVEQLTVSSLDTVDQLVYTGFTDEGRTLSSDIAHRIVDLPVTSTKEVEVSNSIMSQINTLSEIKLNEALEDIKKHNHEYFIQEVDKLNKWADDKIFAAEQSIRDTKKQIKQLNRDARQLTSPEEVLKNQKKLRTLNKKLRRLRQEIFDVEDSIEEQRDAMIEEIELRLKQEIDKTNILTIRWTITD